MKKIVLTLITMLALFAGTAAPAVAATPRLVWKERILLRIDGGECEATGFVSPEYNVWIVPTLMKSGKQWIPGENTLVRVLLNRNGQPCV